MTGPEVQGFRAGDGVCDLSAGERWGLVEAVHPDRVGVRWEDTPEDLTTYGPTQLGYWHRERAR